MTEDLSKDLIERYADLTERLDMLDKNLQELMEKAVPEEVKKAQAEIVAEYFPLIDVASKELEKIKAQIEEQVKVQSTTLKGSRYMAVWNKGRSGGWDTGKLEGYAMVHPEIMGAKKPDGQPTVSFRQVK